MAAGAVGQVAGCWGWSGGSALVHSLSEPKQNVHAGVSDSVMEAKGLEIRGSGIYKAGFTRAGRVEMQRRGLVL